MSAAGSLCGKATPWALPEYACRLYCLVEGIWKPSGLLYLFRIGLPEAEELSLCNANFPKSRIRETPRTTWGLRRFLSTGGEAFPSKNDGERRVPNRAGRQTWFTAAASGVPLGVAGAGIGAVAQWSGAAGHSGLRRVVCRIAKCFADSSGVFVAIRAGRVESFQGVSTAVKSPPTIQYGAEQAGVISASPPCFMAWLKVTL